MAGWGRVQKRRLEAGAEEQGSRPPVSVGASRSCPQISIASDEAEKDCISISASTLSGDVQHLPPIGVQAGLGELRQMLAQQFCVNSVQALKMSLQEQFLPSELDAKLLTEIGVKEGSHISVAIQNVPELCRFRSYGWVDVSASDLKSDMSPNALRVTLPCKTGYKVRDTAAVAFGPPVSRNSTAEWRLHIVSRNREGKINFCLSDKSGVKLQYDQLRVPHYSELQTVWAGARGGWNYANEHGLLFTGGPESELYSSSLGTEKRLPPFLSGCKISLRLQDGQISVTHIDGHGHQELVVAPLPEHFGIPKLEDQCFNDLPADGVAPQPEDQHLDDLPTDGLWCIVHHYAHDRRDEEDDTFILERVE